MSQGIGNPPGKAGAAKPRSTGELIVVRGLIVVGLALAAIEGYGWMGQRNALATLTEKIQAGEKSAKEMPVKQKDVEAAVGGKAPSETLDVRGMGMSNGASQLVKYRWFSFSPVQKRELYVYYGHGQDPDVISVGTTEEETVDQQVAKQQRNAAAAGGGSPVTGPVVPPGAGGPGGGAPGGGPGGPGGGAPTGGPGGPPRGIPGIPSGPLADGGEKKPAAEADKPDDKKPDETAADKKEDTPKEEPKESDPKEEPKDEPKPGQ